MRLTLLHNPTAGDEQHSREALLALLLEAGHDPIYRSTKDEHALSDWDAAAELVLIAGGDGTVRKAAIRLAGRGIPIAILPLGTANNIASCLGIDIPARELVAVLPTAPRHKLDLGIVRGPAGETRFLESLGLGLFTRAMRAAHELHEVGGREASPEEGLELAVRTCEEVLRSATVQDWRLMVDEHDLSGDYLAVEVMNMPCLGPNLALAPEANPGDARLDVVLVTEDDRKALTDYLSRRARGPAVPPRLQVHKATSVHMEWDAPAVHVDDDFAEDARGTFGLAEVRLEAGALELVLPSKR
jgi:diacylglycerol kinase (ATP)